MTSLPRIRSAAAEKQRAGRDSREGGQRFKTHLQVSKDILNYRAKGKPRFAPYVLLCGGTIRLVGRSFKLTKHLNRTACPSSPARAIPLPSLNEVPFNCAAP
ncbi:hypothetical protein FGB62_1g113 [Gracilaria domingensis]|nr:hypothetical protein FGB62_1g113 [Gracilaria domingensis]